MDGLFDCADCGATTSTLKDLELHHCQPNTQFIDRARMRNLAHDSVDMDRVNESFRACLIEIKDEAALGYLSTTLSAEGGLTEMEKEQVKKKLEKRGFTVDLTMDIGKDWRISW